MKQKTILLFLLSIFVLSGCAPGASQAADDLSQRQIRVTTTTGMISDLAKNIGGERVTVTALMGAGVDPHLYKASEGDVRALETADVIFYNGLHLEAGLSGVLERMADRQKVVAVSNSIEREQLLAPPEFAGSYDPHIWFDVTLWMTAAQTVCDTLTEIDPQNQELYLRNLDSYLADLQQLHEYVVDQAGKLPEERRVLVTAHDAFNYFGRAYGFEVRGLQGISTEAEAGTADLQGLADFVTARQIPAIFIETSVAQRNIQAVQAAVQARGWNVQIGGSLFSDAMGSPGTPEGTYIGMVSHNIDTIVQALLLNP